MSTTLRSFKYQMTKPNAPRSFDFPPPRGPLMMKRVACRPSGAWRSHKSAKMRRSFGGKRIDSSIRRSSVMGLCPKRRRMSSGLARTAALSLRFASEKLGFREGAGEDGIHFVLPLLRQR